MQKNRIVVFNRVIDKKLEDCSFFEDLLENHYRKFTYGYNIIALGDLIDNIRDIECECMESELKFIISLRKKATKKFKKAFEDNIDAIYNSKKFNVIDIIFSDDLKEMSFIIVKVR